MFAEYIDWRAEHPSDDIMTELMNAEFEDETGTGATLRREEILTYITVVAGAGNETTTRLIGWAGKVLAEHPDQRRELVEDPSLIPNAIEELLRFEPPAPHVGRYVAETSSSTARRCPRAARCSCLVGAANRDERRYPGRRPLRHPPRDRPAPHLRLRRALLPRRGAGPARGSGRARGDPEALPGVGGRLVAGAAPRADVDASGAGSRCRSCCRSLRARDRHRSPRRRYDSPVRRQQAAETRERIVAAGAELLTASRP